MLFLGGGVTAAALIAKNQFAESAGHPPDVAGMMEAPLPKETCPPPEAGAVEAPEALPTPEVPPPMPGAVPMPQPAVDGNMVLPAKVQTTKNPPPSTMGGARMVSYPVKEPGKKP